MSARDYELADFNPTDGHLHECGRGEYPDAPPCKCAAHLYTIASDVAGVVVCDILYRCADCGADRQPEDVIQDDECGTYHCRTHATECT